MDQEDSLEKKLKAIDWYEKKHNFSPCIDRDVSCNNPDARAYQMQCDKEYSADCPFYRPYHEADWHEGFNLGKYYKIQEENKNAMRKKV